jgi:hypothetical protein
VDLQWFLFGVLLAYTVPFIVVVWVWWQSGPTRELSAPSGAEGLDSYPCQEDDPRQC